MTATCRGRFAVLERFLHGLGHPDHVDLGPAARRAGDEVEALALAQPERLEQLPPGARLFHRVGGERVPDGVADALGEERGDPGGALQRARRAAGPASVTPRCSGWSKVSEASR